MIKIHGSSGIEFPNNYSIKSDSGDLTVMNDVNKLWGMNSTGYESKPNIVAFSAYGRHDDFGGHSNGTYAGSDRVMFNGTVRYNYGNSYNSTNSIFTAPIAGFYFITFNCHNNGSGVHRVSLLVNESFQPVGTGQVTTNNNFSQTSIIYLDAGDYVFVHNAYAGSIIYHAEGHNEFSGYLIGSR